jgi:hypothetical protein
MSDLSSNETLDPLENTASNDAYDANVVDNTPEDWESIIDFEMKNGKEDVTMESSKENDLSLANRLQAKEDNLQKGEDIAIETNNETTPVVNNTGAAHIENNNSMAIEETSTDKTDGTSHPNDTATVPQAPAGAVDQHTNTNEHISIPRHMYQRLLQKGIMANDQQMNRPRSMVESQVIFKRFIHFCFYILCF